jgi:uncharacterized protein (UPF0335 family)
MTKLAIKQQTKVGDVVADQLKSIIDRVEKLEEEKSGIAADIKDIFVEAKSNGFDTDTIKAIIKVRKLDAQTREEKQYTFDTYCRALGMSPMLGE